MRTPHLDQLARTGVYFHQATVHVPQCSPGRAMLLTGMPPHRNHWYSNQYQDAPVRERDGFKGLPLLPAVLQRAGYQTVLTGKWHLAADPWNCGFTQVRTWLPGGGGPYRHVPLAHGNSRKLTETAGYLQEVLADDVIAFLKSDEAKAKPFFHWAAFTAPHIPYCPNPPRIEKLYAGKSKKDLLPPGFPAAIPTGDWLHYCEAITFLDEQVGRILQTLDDTKLAEKTVVVFLGDNGYMMGEHGVGAQGGAGKVVPYENSIRVPLIVRAPGIGKSHGANEAAVSSLDLPTSFARLAGATPPADWPGRNLVPLLRGHTAEGFGHAICEWADNHSQEFGHLAYRLVRTPAHKLIV